MAIIFTELPVLTRRYMTLNTIMPVLTQPKLEFLPSGTVQSSFSRRYQTSLGWPIKSCDTCAHSSKNGNDRREYLRTSVFFLSLFVCLTCWINLCRDTGPESVVNRGPKATFLGGKRGVVPCTAPYPRVNQHRSEMPIVFTRKYHIFQ